MVTPKNGDALREANFQSDQEGNSLNGIVATVNVVACISRSAQGTSIRRNLILTHEEIVGVWIWSANLEELHQIVELAMYVTTHGDRAFLHQKISFTSHVKEP